MQRQTICLCGSGRFFDEILQHAAELTLRGYVVLQPNFNASQSSTKVLDAVDKMRLDELHFDKIDMSSEVLVVCPNGYVGESTAREIFYARRTNKPVTLTHPTQFISRLEDAQFVGFLKSADAYVVEHLRQRGVSQSAELNAERWIESFRAERAREVQTSPVVQAAGRLHHERTKLLEQAADLLDALEAAWGVIANGPWSIKAEEKSDWTKAAERWRDRYHELLRSEIYHATAKIRAQRSLRDRFSRLIDGLNAGSLDLRTTFVEELGSIADMVKKTWADPVKPA